MRDEAIIDEKQAALLEVRGLKTYFYTKDGIVKAVDGVDFALQRGEIFGLVGESGCGKTVTALSILRLIDRPGVIVGGEVTFKDIALHELGEKEMAELRGRKISMIFQQPISSLNPVFSGGDQVAEVLRIHRKLHRDEAWKRALELFRTVGIADAEEKAHAYPHELSGGQAQRVMIAMALATDPELLIADEPSTALDVTIQAQILDLLKELRVRMGTSVILITHDLGVIAEIADRVAVMYAGTIVEKTDVGLLFEEPLHPYTQGLMASIPVLGKVTERLDVIPGAVPNLIHLPAGCRFAPRCRARLQHGLEICNQREPGLMAVRHEHDVRCWLYLDDDGHQAPLRLR